MFIICQINWWFSIQSTGFQSAFFEKDNDVRTGSKGDYIFRDYENKIEVISIMFEMKNENDATTIKRKNEEFLKELDKDRREKNCEYAVLVSLLEIENEFYNNGIVDMAHRFPKMYVIYDYQSHTISFSQLFLLLLNHLLNMLNLFLNLF